MPDVNRPYVADKPPLVPSRDELRARIPGWGADLDPKDRPAVPRERFDPAATGAHWDLPERQEETVPRERSIEHGMLPPVFGTVAPLHGVSGLIRRTAYARFGEARLAHWLLLMAGDRVEATGARLRAAISAHPDDPITETGVRTESVGRELAALRSSRGDTKHRWMDPLLVTGPWLITGVIGWRILRSLLRRR